MGADGVQRESLYKRIACHIKHGVWPQPDSPTLASLLYGAMCIRCISSDTSQAWLRCTRQQHDLLPFHKVTPAESPWHQTCEPERRSIAPDGACGRVDCC